MMHISIQIDADFELILFNIDAGGLGDSVIGQILMIQIFMQIDAYF